MAGRGELFEGVVDVGDVERAVRVLQSDEVIFETGQVLDQFNFLHFAIGQRLLDAAQLRANGVNLLHCQGVGLTTEFGTDPGRKIRKKGSIKAQQGSTKF